MKAIILLFIFINFSVCIPLEETEDYKKSKIWYYAQIAKLNATDPCQLNFKCNDREECVNFPKCKTGESCPRTKCVPRKLCESTICPPGTECAEFKSNLGDLTEYKYNFKPLINYIGDTRGIRPACVSRKVPSNGNICGENEELNTDKSGAPMGMSESTCSIPSRYGIVQTSFNGPFVDYCLCKKDFVRDDINGACIHNSLCTNKKSTHRPKPWEIQNEKTQEPKVSDIEKSTKLPINAIIPTRSKFHPFKKEGKAPVDLYTIKNARKTVLRLNTKRFQDFEKFVQLKL